MPPRTTLSMRRVRPKRTARETSAAPSIALELVERRRRRRPRRSPGARAAPCASVSSRIARSRPRVALAGLEGRLRGEERAVKHGRRAALLGREVDVAAAQGEPVRFPHGRAHDDVDGKGEVGDHPPDHGDLLRVLLSEVGPVRLEHVEELRDHGRDAAEVSGAARALERRAHLVHGDPGLETRRVDLVRPTESRRRPRRATRGAPRSSSGVLGYAARSSFGPNWAGFTKMLADDVVVLVPRARHERQVARVQRAHRGHEAQRPPGPAPERAHLGDGREDLHAAARAPRRRRRVSFAGVGTPTRAPSRTTAPLIASISVGAPLSDILQHRGEVRFRGSGDASRLHGGIRERKRDSLRARDLGDLVRRAPRGARELRGAREAGRSEPSKWRSRR